MRTYYVFQSGSVPELRGFTDEASGHALPLEHRPWSLSQQIGPQDEWNLNVSRSVVAAGVFENGFYVWKAGELAPSSRPNIESDRVEGTAVFDRHGTQIGTIKRLIIEKVSGRVVYVDVTFGGFLGLGIHHRTIPWDKLTYDREFGGYRTEITEAQVEGAPSFHGDERVWSDRRREQQMREYWEEPPRRPI
jgi:PRC-barrel domain